MKTSIKIALWCLGVGLVLAIIGLDPLELWIGLGEFGQSVFDWFVELGRWLGPFILAGAVIVLLIAGIRWLIGEAKRRKRRARSTPPSEDI
jgi:hypothetical protein